ncbi:ATP-binding protein [Elioraea sp.]|uniref:ATP-binding protein n=1 Tax=Elioraea sp. TaxID=2185103 RepID=UPI0025C2287A|nr:ATP-binding protein [Elioraea sp.]
MRNTVPAEPPRGETAASPAGGSGSGHVSRRSPIAPAPRRRLAGRATPLLAALAAVTLALPLWAGALLRDRTLAEAEREITTQADIVAAATERRLQALRYALDGLPSWIDGPVLASGAVDDDVHAALGRLTGAGADGIGFLALAPDGRLVATARGVVTPGAQMNHLAWPSVATLGPRSPSGLAISAPFAAAAAHIAGRPVVAISRALPSGGWVQAIVPLDIGTTLLPATDLGEGSWVWLIRQDGQGVARWPGPAPLPVPRFDDAPLFTRLLPAAPSGGSTADVLLGAGEAISAYRSLPEYGLVIVVKRDRAAILARWRTGMLKTVAGLVIALIAVAALAWRASRATLALNRSEERSTMAADALGLLLWSADNKTATPLHHSLGAETITGYSQAALVSRPRFWREVIVHPDDLARVSATFDGADLAVGCRQTYRIIRADGAVRWVDSRSREAAGGGIVGMVEDVTARKETQDRLARSEAELAEALRISGMGRWRFDLATQRFTFTDTIFEQCGLDRDTFDPTAPNMMALILPDDRRVLDDAFRRVHDTGETVEFEYRLRRPDGTIRLRWARAGRECDPGGRLVAIVGVCQDITERREAAAERAHTSRMAALGQLTGGIAHDVNNMLTVVSLNLDLLADDVAPGTLAGEALEAARHAAGGGAALTAQLLAFARRQPLSPEAVDVALLFDELRPMLAHSLGGGVTAVLEAAPGTAPVLADAAQLRSALLNLAINARDAMPAGGTICISAAPAKGGGAVAFAVADNGTGMPKEVAARAFEPFFTTKPSGKGTGLGLSQVYGFVTQSQGTITIESEPGAGTIVRFTLPEAAAPARAAHGRAGAVPGGASILVVEDEPELRAAVVAMCQGAGLSVATAANAAEALGRLEAGFVPDLLFTDINLGPGPDGVALAAVAERRLPGLPVLFASGFAADANLPEGARVLHKPYAREALLAALADMLNHEAVPGE